MCMDDDSKRNLLKISQRQTITVDVDKDLQTYRKLRELTSYIQCNPQLTIDDVREKFKHIRDAYIDNFYYVFGSG